MLLSIGVRAQELRVQIEVAGLPASAALIDLRLRQGAERLSFRNSYAGILGLANRIDSVSGFRRDGEAISLQRTGPGEFRSIGKFTHFQYQVKLGRPDKPSDMAHVSWLSGDLGFLMLSDLLPEFGTGESGRASVQVEFSLPTGWRVASAVRPERLNSYFVSEPDKTVFFVGKSLREKTMRLQSMEFGFITAGEWSFPDEEVTRLAEQVIKEYVKRTGFRPGGRSVLMLAPFPPKVSAGSWSAETRGSTTTLMFGRSEQRRNSLAQLGVAFTHELFHLWVPNALGLGGDYDWFFEGFTLYEALRAALRLKFINFDEFLATISRVYNSYLSLGDRNRVSLLEASERRWTGSSSLVYDKGMLVAFIYDLALRLKTGSKASLDDVYQALFRARQDKLLDANEVIINALSASEGMNEFATSYIRDNASIELEAFLKPYGLKIESIGSTKHLVLGGQLTGDQMKLLRSLGYKN